MNLRTLITGVIASIGLISFGAKAHAQCTTFPVTPCSFTLNPSINPSAPPPTVHGASGTYTVTLTANGSNSYTIQVVGVNDGNAPTGAQGVPNPGPQSTDAKAGLDLLSITATRGSAGIFFDAPPGSGSSTKYVAGPGVGSNLGGHSNQPYGTAAGPWNGTTPASDTLTFTSTANTTIAVAPRGGNEFLGTFSVFTSTLVPTTLGGATKLQMSAQDNGQQWSGEVILGTPEPSALALVLPGLAPLGLALRRRRRSTRS